MQEQRRMLAAHSWNGNTLLTQMPRHIYWFAYYDLREPSVRYRAYHVLQALRHTYGTTGDLVLPGYSLHRVMQFVRIFLSVVLFPKRGAIIVFQKTRTRRIYGTLLRWLARQRRLPIVYDMDDADYLHFPEDIIHYFLKSASGVVAGSEALACYARPHCSSVRRITSPVTPHGYTGSMQRSNPLVVGWIGYYEAHRDSLHQLVFPAFAGSPIPIRLLLLGVTRPEDFEELQAFCAAHRHLSLEAPDDVDWNNEADIYRRMTRCQVAVSPMLDTEWNRAKSAYKAKQFLSCGVPVLASPVGENTRFVQHGKNGFLCETSSDFAAMLNRIATIPNDAYQDLCLAALESAAAFRMDQVAKEWNRFGNQLLDPRSPESGLW